MRTLWVTVLLSCALAPLVVLASCGEDEALIRERDGGAIPDANVGDGGTLMCGEPIPTTYASPNFAANTGIETALRARFTDIENAMRATEGASTSTVTAAALKAFFDQGNPSLRSVSTTNAQTLLDGYFAQYELAMGKTWTPADGEGDAGASISGGKLTGTFYFSGIGVDLREAVQKTMLGGSFYNHAVGVSLGPPSDATVDRLLAIFGASPALANRTDADAGADQDLFIAEYASKRDDKSQPDGIYRRIKKALLSMRAAALAGDRCRADYNAALAVYFREWERTTFATAIFYLNDAATKAVAPNVPAALHSYGEALGFIQSFKGIDPAKRKITDIQIDTVLAAMGATTPYKLGVVTSAGQRAIELSSAIGNIATIQEFSAAEVETFKRNF